MEDINEKIIDFLKTFKDDDGDLMFEGYSKSFKNVKCIILLSVSKIDTDELKNDLIYKVRVVLGDIEVTQSELELKVIDVPEYFDGLEFDVIINTSFININISFSKSLEWMVDGPDFSDGSIEEAEEWCNELGPVIYENKNPYKIGQII